MKRLIGAIAGGGIAIFAGATSLDDDTTRDSAGVIVEPGGLGVLAIEVGDCLQLPDGGETEVMSLEGVPCDVPHDAQAYASFDLADGRYPGVDAVDQDAFDGCEARWEASIGTTWEDDRVYDVTWLAPTADGWRWRDRGVLCLVVRIDGQPISVDLLRP